MGDDEFYSQVADRIFRAHALDAVEGDALKMRGNLLGTGHAHTKRSEGHESSFA